MNFYKRLLSLGLAGTLALSLAGCGKTDVENVEVVEPGDITEYSITICRGSDNSFDDALIAGFQDALDELMENTNITYTQITTDTISMATAAAGSSVSSGADLIFTTDKYTLQGAMAATEEIPIVATGVVDFQRTLRIASTGSTSWDKCSGRNITGVTSRPSIVDQTSLLIEVTDDLQTVGILYSSEDTDAIYQNEILEKYLNQAGIPWKEYEIPVTQKAMEESESEQGTIAVSPSKKVAASAKEGVNNTVVPLVEDGALITGINSPSSTRTANISPFWTNGKIITSEEPEDSTTEETEDTEENEEDEEQFEITEESTLAERIEYACSECSVLYIPFDSLLSDQMAEIGDITTKNSVITVGGDVNLAEHCLATLYFDPYQMGYSAGKKAKKILADNADPATMKITSISDDPVKLYNGTIAEQLGLTFPKSFKELHSFFESVR